MFDCLKFTSVPKTWEEYLPLGNGRLGCMVKTHPINEVIQLNEEGIWSGGPQNRANPDTQKTLPLIRNLVKEGRVLEAQELGFETMSGTCINERVYQTAGEFKIDFFSKNDYGIEVGWPLGHKTHEKCLETYKSELSLSDACTVVTYTDQNNVTFTRKTWISAVDDVIFVHVTASEKGKINFRGFLDRGIWVDKIFADDNFIFLEDKHGIPFCVGCGAIADGGKIFTSGVQIAGDECDEVLFFIDIKSWKWQKNHKNEYKKLSPKDYESLIRKNTWTRECKEKLTKIKNFIDAHGVSVAAEDYFAWHLEEYHSYWDRFSMKIGDSHKAENENSNSECDLSTPELLKTVNDAVNSKSQKNENETTLINLYTNFSRYLLISASRKPGILPTTLQGLWNGYMDPPWGSKYTININAQMNYWPVNMANLSECELPFFELLERGYKNGVEVAQKMYGCRGYVLHHNTDYWGDAAPQDTWLPGTYWVLGAAWMATHIWEHFEYTCDLEFLQKYYYLLHEACKFFVDYLQPCDMTALDGKPYLVINPSLSPENSYVTKAGQVGAFTEGCEMDNMILEHLFKSCLSANRVLNKKSVDNKGHLYDKDDFTSFEYVLAHLKKPELNSDGSLMEWNTEVSEVEPGHRHISHLYGLYPGHTITVEKTPTLADACKKTLEKRLSNGGGHTGWSQSWIINFRAQLEQGDDALEALQKLLSHSTLPNLLDNHPPFQIDGNFGSLAAVIRMLIQSETQDDGTVLVKFLPALPSAKEWQNGSIRGVSIKGGYTVDFDWRDGKVENVELKASSNSISRELIVYQMLE